MSIAQEIMSGPDLPDYKAITTLVLLSEPPCAGDVESHVKFCKTWGGGKAQPIIIDICDYIKMCSMYLKVSAGMFDACSSLKCPPHILPTRLIAAMIKTVATRGAGRDGVGTKVGVKEVRMMTGLTESSKYTKANTFIEKAFKLCENAINADADELARIRGEFECDLVENVFEVCTDDKLKDLTMEKIVERFLQTLQGMRIEPQCDVTDDLRPSAPVFDSTAPDAVVQALKSIGVETGALLWDKKDMQKQLLEKQYMVAYINDDGSVGIQRVTRDGTHDKEVVPVMMDDLNKYTVIKKEQKIKISKFSQPAVITNELLAMIADSALHAAYAKHKANLEDDVCIQTVPKCRLMARRDLAPDSLTLVPWTSSVVRKPLPQTSEIALFVKVMIDSPARFEIKSPSGIGKDLEVEFWRVQTEKDTKKIANLVKHNIVVPVNWPFDVGLGEIVNVEVPTLVLSKAVSADNELKVFGATTSKKAKFQLSVADMGAERPSKKAK